MILTLEISGPEAAKLGAASRKVFDVGGGTIGRLPDNDWVLPDRYVSSRHARIEYESGVYYLVDESTNGVCINSPDNHLVAGRPYALASGDWILIDPYEIRVSISTEVTQPAGASGSSRPFDTPPQRVVASLSSDAIAPADPFADSQSAVSEHGFASKAADVGASSDPLPGEEVDPLSLLGLEPKRPAPKNAPRAADLAGASILSDHYRAPAIPPVDPPLRPVGLIPDDYDPLVSDDHSVVPPSVAVPSRPGPKVPASPSGRSPAEMPRGAQPVRQPSRPVPQVHSSGSAPGAVRPHAVPEEIAPATPGARREEGSLGDVLAGAGLARDAVTPELARTFGQIFRVVVEGVMDVLQARQRLKDEFRMRMTTFGRADNNPLKFSANVEDALHNLLVKRNAAYLSPVDAFDDAFDDLRYHQMAMLAGMRAGFEAMVAEFEPERLQQEFDRQLKKGALISVPAKLRYWELYRDRFHDMVKDSDVNFRVLFGSVFTKAYEEQLARLKHEGKARKR